MQTSDPSIRITSPYGHRPVLSEQFRHEALITLLIGEFTQGFHLRFQELLN